VCAEKTVIYEVSAEFCFTTFMFPVCISPILSCKWTRPAAPQTAMVRPPVNGGIRPRNSSLSLSLRIDRYKDSISRESTEQDEQNIRLNRACEKTFSVSLSYRVSFSSLTHSLTHSLSSASFTPS